MFKNLICVAIFFFGLVFAEVQEAQGCGNGGCHKPAKPCCGCDTRNAKSKIRVLSNLFLEKIAFCGTRADALQLTTECNSIFVQGELCTNGWGCCQWESDVEDFFSHMGDNFFQYWIHDIEYLHCGDYMVQATVSFNYPQSPPKSLAFRVNMLWVPSEGCNWKIKAMEALSYACELPVSLNCTECILG